MLAHLFTFIEVGRSRQITFILVRFIIICYNVTNKFFFFSIDAMVVIKLLLKNDFFLVLIFN